MNKWGVLLLAGVFLAPALAANPATKIERDRQVHEVVFQNYPPRALAAGEEGPVFFVVTLGRDAHPTSCQITHGSGHPLLDAETCTLIIQHAVFNSAKDADGNLVSQTTEGVVNWTLPGHQPAPINFTPAATSNLPEKQICKKSLKPGYLSVYERTCMTASEWQAQRNDAKDTYGQMQGKKENPGSAACIDPSGC
jgi:TonB family protein